MDVLALSSPPQEHARFHRPAALPGVEALHATFIHHRYPAHVHDYWVIARVDCGAAAFELDGRWHTAAAGSTFIIPPGAAHTGESATDRGYSYRVLYLDWPAYADGAGPPQAEDSLLGSPISHDRRCAQSLDQLHQAIIQPGRALEQGEALAAVSHALRDAIRPSAGRLGRGRHPAVARAEAFIHERWWENFTLHELAAAADVSPFHLVRLFHRNIGMPPSAYRRALRVQAAQKLLRRGEPAGGVALTCGFYDQAHLARHFKAVTGVTPSHYAHAG